MNITVSVCVVVFHTEPGLLKDCLSSVRAQELPVDVSLKLIVVDNSRDAELKDQFESLADLWSMTGENGGFARGMNRAVALAEEGWLLLLNPDASLARDGVAKLLKVGELHGTDNVFGCWLENDDKVQVDAMMDWTFSSTRLLKRRAYRAELERQKNQTVVSVEKISGGSCWATRETLNFLGPYDERFFLYGEDVDMSRRAKSSGRELLCVPSVRVRHLAASSQANHSALVEAARADAAVRVSAYHSSTFVSYLFRVEFLFITLVGLLPLTATSSGNRRARSQRLKVVRRWGLKKEMPAWRPSDD